MAKNFTNTTPASWAVLISLWTMLIAMATPILNDKLKIAILAIAFAIYITSFASIISITHAYEKNSKTLGGFIQLYLDTTFLFAAIYFFMTALTPKGEAIYGVTVICMKADCYKGPLEQFLNLTESFLDCFYLSILTMTTSGDTNIGVKTFWGRAIISFQLITTVYISIVGLAKYFSYKSSEELAEFKASILKKINSIEPTTRHVTPEPGLINKLFQKLKRKNT